MNPQLPPLADPHSTHPLPVDKKARVAKAIALCLMMTGSLIFAFGVFCVLGLIFNVVLASPSRPSTLSLEDAPLFTFMAAIPCGLGFLLFYSGVRRWRRH